MEIPIDFVQVRRLPPVQTLHAPRLRFSYDMTKDVKPEDITPVQYTILEYIAVSQPVTLSQISDCQRMSMPNTSRGRPAKQYIRLSKEGQALMDGAFTRIEARFLQRLADTSDDELAEIEQALDVRHAKVFFTPS